MFIPKNEAGVMYLFSRYHEELGFEKIIKFNTTTGFPDIVALRDGKKVRIELEHTLGKIRVHYECIKSTNHEWFWDDGFSVFREKDRFIPEHVVELFLENAPKNRIKHSLVHEEISNEPFFIVSDPLRQLKKGGKKNLVYKSIKQWCDIVVCWEIGSYRMKDDLEVIELKNKFIQTKLKDARVY